MVACSELHQFSFMFTNVPYSTDRSHFDQMDVAMTHVMDDKPLDPSNDSQPDTTLTDSHDTSTVSVLHTALSHVRCAEPFSYLGWQKQPKGWRIVLWSPHRVPLAAHSKKTGAMLGEFTAFTDAPGLYQLNLPRKRKTELYTVVWQLNGEQIAEHSAEYVATHCTVDPYQLQEMAYHAVHFVAMRPQNLYRQLGAHMLDLSIDGQALRVTRFAVYAPNASAVSLIGDFNQWDGRCHPMQRTQCGHWVLCVPDLAEGARYKFEIKDLHGHVLPHKADPMAFAAEQYPSHASLVQAPSSYRWQDSAWQQREFSPYQAPMSIYELHLGSWQTHADGQPLNYLELADRLIPYIQDMGFTHIELLPVMEHPYSGSWGYQPLGMFAVTSRFGTPDMFRAFVDRCHQAHIGVILDWVPAHFPEDGHGLAKFDGSSLYEYADPRRGWHPDWNSCIYDFGKDYVRQFLVASALYWLEHFHIDGLRVDAVASMLYLDYSRRAGEWIPNIDGGNHNYEAISLCRWLNSEVRSHFPNALVIAEESTSFAGVSRPVSEGGLGFHFKWNMGWMNDSLRYISKDPAYRQYHHNDITFSMVYAYDEHFILPLSHDEVVHGKGSILHKMPGDEWQQAASMRAYIAFMFAHPGKKLNFMGNEFAQGDEWNHNIGLPWHLLEYDKHRGMQQLYRDLNHTYRRCHALYRWDHDHRGFRWIDYQDALHSTLAFSRHAEDGDVLYVVCNFTPVPRPGYRLPVAHAGHYQVILNTDSRFYWGSDWDLGSDFHTQPTLFQQSEHLQLDLPPLATLFIRWVP